MCMFSFPQASLSAVGDDLTKLQSSSETTCEQVASNLLSATQLISDSQTVTDEHVTQIGGSLNAGTFDLQTLLTVEVLRDRPSGKP